ncbi:Protein CL16A [Podila humilis]|nr:Protein CL16A [Podila humilis]
MFENVRSRESLYFLLSNNYVNQVIGLRYDFSNDEILAYYIYLLRTLSFKLSKDTIYFFFNEHLDDFPLYSEAIKFFNHEESMVRIAVRVITLNVYSVNDKKMQDFILDRTTTTYFSNLVWFIGNYGTTVNDMLLHPGEGEFSRMNYYLAEHMDCFYYVNDIIELEVPKINKILISNLLNRLLRPMYLDSLLTAGASTSASNKTTSISKLLPLVALSLMLHAFHVLKHAPLISALASTLFSNQHCSHNTHHPTPHHRPTTLPLMLGQQSVSPESSRPASPVTSKFHSFGLLGTSPGAMDSFLPPLSTHSNTLLTLHLQHQQQQEQPQQQQKHHPPGGREQGNPYKTSIFEYLAHTDNDRLVLPSLALIYLIGRNPGVMPDVLLGTDIYPQRLLKSRLLMGNLTSSAPISGPGQGGTAMVRERSSDSILSISSNVTSGGGSAGVAIRTFGTHGVPSSSGGGSLFGGAGAATAARMRTRTESPLFVTEEDNEESRETEELLAESEVPIPELGAVGSPFSQRRTPPSGTTSEVRDLPTSSSLSSVPLPSKSPSTRPLPKTRSHSAEPVEVLLSSPNDVSPRVKSGTRRGSKASSLFGPILPGTTLVSSGEPPVRKDSEFGQELRPVHTSKEDRVVHSVYDDDVPYADDDDASSNNGADSLVGVESEKEVPPPLPPRRPLQDVDTDDDQTAIAASIQEQSYIGPVIHSRDELIDRLMDIICGQPESGAHRFRILTIQMATELLIEFVYTKGGSGKEPSGSHPSNSIGCGHSGSAGSGSGAGESQLDESRMQRLVLAEAQLRDRVQKGIVEMEKRKIAVSPVFMDADKRASLLSTFSVKAERSLTESKLGIDRQIVNMISESTIMYGPDKVHHSDPDLDPDPDLVILFGLDPDYVGPFAYEKSPLSAHDDDDTANVDRVSIASGSSTSTTVQGRSDGHRQRIRDKIKNKMYNQTPPNSSGKQNETTQHTQNKPSLTALQRLDAMVVRYIKWLHILIQCRRLLCKKALTPAIVAGHGIEVIASSPVISVTESPPAPTPVLGRRPSDLMMATSGSGTSTGTGAGAVASAHRGLQKALATTATTTALTASTTVAPVSLLTTSLTASPATTANSDSTSSTSNSSMSSMASSPSNTSGATSISATISQPGSVSATGATGSRALLTATAALEAAAGSGSLGHGGSNSNLHPLGPLGSASASLSSHLDPLSASVSEAIRKSGAKLKTMVDPLSGNQLFKSSGKNITLPAQQDSQQRQNLGSTLSTSAPVSAASSIVSLNRTASAASTAATGMQRTLSSSSRISGRSPDALEGGTSRDEIGPPETVDGEQEHGSTSTKQQEDGFKSILDPTHPAHQSGDPILKVFEALGLVNYNKEARPF